MKYNRIIQWNFKRSKDIFQGLSEPPRSDPIGVKFSIESILTWFTSDAVTNISGIIE